MRIIHFMLSNFFIDGYGYQENILPRQNIHDGHTVRIIASTETYSKRNTRIGYVRASDYINEDGIRITRLPYRKVFPQRIMKKIRAYPGVMDILLEFKPDVIFAHGISAFESLTMVRYKKNYPKTRLYFDQHGDENNSARNIFSKFILHKIFFMVITKIVEPGCEKIFYVSEECGDFLKKYYRIDKEKIEFFPLGGIINSELEIVKYRMKIRADLGVADDTVMIIHSGKMTKRKKTIELIDAFMAVPSDKLVLVLIGSLDDEIEHGIMERISQDRRIAFLGWKSGNELTHYLQACDLYAQPGTQSATMQNAICSFAPVMLYPYKGHKHYIKGNGFFVKDQDDICDVLRKVATTPSILKEMREKSKEIAYNLLDYRKLAARIY